MGSLVLHVLFVFVWAEAQFKSEGKVAPPPGVGLKPMNPEILSHHSELTWHLIAKSKYSDVQHDFKLLSIW